MTRSDSRRIQRFVEHRRNGAPARAFSFVVCASSHSSRDWTAVAKIRTVLRIGDRLGKREHLRRQSDALLRGRQNGSERPRAFRQLGPLQSGQIV